MADTQSNGNPNQKTKIEHQRLPGTPGNYLCMMSLGYCFPIIIFMHILYDYEVRNTTETMLTKMPGRCLSIFGLCFYNKQCSESTHTAINSDSLLPSSLNSGLAPTGQRCSEPGHQQIVYSFPFQDCLPAGASMALDFSSSGQKGGY